MEIKKSNTSIKVNGFEIKLIGLFGEYVYAFVDGDKIRYFNNLADALNVLNSHLAYHPENCAELIEAISRK